ncbi:MAG: biopolymer transporter ExbD [Candidatus Cloacimonetes bacterium HGW-Cloacimonetes-2]|nr:MAG: biopolymer transporter ExbD [Candidatus Cloacimonetes bacterium HGW-Cloacimonetes-2]
MKIQTSKQKISSTMLISMTDVIFLLIIFLLIASNFTSQTGLPVKLPGSVSASRMTNLTIHIVYRDEQNILLDGKNYDLKGLELALEDLFETNEQVVRLSAEKTTDLQSLINVMDVIRLTGFEKIFVATERTGKAK